MPSRNIIKKISIKAKPGAKVASVIEKDGKLVVAVKERATDGKANRAIEKAVAKYFGVAPSACELSPATMREKRSWK